MCIASRLSEQANKLTDRVGIGRSRKGSNSNLAWVSMSLCCIVTNSVFVLKVSCKSLVCKSSSEFCI